MFFGLDSLQTLHLDYNRLITLQEDVFNHLPRPLTISVNPLLCDSKLFLLRQEQKQGSIRWYYYIHRSSYKYRPECTNGIWFDTWDCNKTGKFVYNSLCMHTRGFFAQLYACVRDIYDILLKVIF